MPVTFFDHTGDIGVRLAAPTLEGLFADAALAFVESITDPGTVEARAPHPVEIASPSLDLLLVDWLDELLYLFEVQNLLVARADVQIVQQPSTWLLKGVLGADTFDPERHPIKVLVKGVTYHQLDVRQTAAGWETTVIFDI